MPSRSGRTAVPAERCARLEFTIVKRTFTIPFIPLHFLYISFRLSAQCLYTLLTFIFALPFTLPLHLLYTSLAIPLHFVSDLRTIQVIFPPSVGGQRPPGIHPVGKRTLLFNISCFPNRAQHKHVQSSTCTMRRSAVHCTAPHNGSGCTELHV